MKKTIQKVAKRMNQKVREHVVRFMRPSPHKPRLLAVPTLRELREEFANWKTFDRFSLEEFS